MILEILEPPAIDPTQPPEVQLEKLRSFTTVLVEKLNAAFAEIGSEASFNAAYVGTPNERATGKARRVSQAVSDIDMGYHNIKNVRPPSDSNDVVTVEYLNSVLSKKGV